MAIASNLGFPRIGVHRELKRAVEGFWRGDVEPDELQATARGLRRRHWQLQHEAGIEHIPSDDFSLYDHVLGHGGHGGGRFRGGSAPAARPSTWPPISPWPAARQEVVPLDMTKWFDTNYHYLVPEFEPRQSFRLASTAAVDAFSEALALGIRTRPVLLGPVRFLLLGKSKAAGVEPLALLERSLPIYEELIRRLARAGAEWVQIDEPVLALDLTPRRAPRSKSAYAQLADVSAKIKICLATYFGGLRDNLAPRCGCRWRPSTSTWSARRSNWTRPSSWSRRRACCRWA